MRGSVDAVRRQIFWNQEMEYEERRARPPASLLLQCWWFQCDVMTGALGIHLRSQILFLSNLGGLRISDMTGGDSLILVFHNFADAAVSEM